jgi:hypothetical protein
MRKTYLKNNPTHKYTIETTGWYKLWRRINLALNYSTIG